MGVQPQFRLTEATWLHARDGNPTGMALFERHYTFRQGRKVYQFVGPGEKMVLLTPCARALFVWRKFISDAPLSDGINCAVFHNEGAGLASDLIRAADAEAGARWPGERHYTYVNPRKVRSSNPGCCFLKAGWRKCGVTKGGLLILERPA